MSWMKGYSREVDKVPKENQIFKYSMIVYLWIAHSIILSCDHTIVGFLNIFTMVLNEIFKNNTSMKIY